jgi:hypothetical protein
MNRQSTPWEQLMAAARRAPVRDERDDTAPFGFAARVAAQAMSSQRESFSLFDHFSPRASLRALGVACAMALVVAGASYPMIDKLFADNVAPEESLSLAPAAASPAAADALQVPAPAADVPAVNPASGDDPVAELLSVVS